MQQNIVNQILSTDMNQEVQWPRDKNGYICVRQQEAIFRLEFHHHTAGVSMPQALLLR